MWFYKFFRRKQPAKNDRLGSFLQELKDRPQEQIMPSDVVKFSDPLRAVFTHATREGKITFSKMNVILDLTEAETQQVVDYIVEKGFLCAPSPLDIEPVYETRFEVRTRRKEDVIPKDILSKLDNL